MEGGGLSARAGSGVAAADFRIAERAAGYLRAAAQDHIEPVLAGEAPVDARHKAAGGLVTQVDHAIQEQVCGELAGAFPEAGFLGEEMATEEQRRALEQGAGNRLWCLDPLDGTSNFASGIPIFGLSLALLEDGAPRVGVVFDPVRDELFTAVRGGGAYCNGRRLSVRRTPRLADCVGVLDLKRLPGPVAQRLVADQPFHSQRNFGSSVLEWCWLAAGRVDFYLHGGQNLWDFAAGALIAQEAGADIATLEGEPLFAGDILRRSLLALGSATVRAELAPYLSPGGAETGG